MSKEQALYINHWITFSPDEIKRDNEILFTRERGEKFKDFTKRLYKQLPDTYPKYFKMDAISKLAFLSGNMLLSPLNLNDFSDEKVAMVMANSSSTIETDIKFQESLASIPSPSVFVYTLPNIMVGELSIRFGFKGENLFLIDSEFNPELLTENVQMLFNHSDTEMCITGWVDFFSPEDFSIRLMVVSNNIKGIELSKETLYSQLK